MDANGVGTTVVFVFIMAGVVSLFTALVYDVFNKVDTAPVRAAQVRKILLYTCALFLAAIAMRLFVGRW